MSTYRRTPHPIARGDRIDPLMPWQNGHPTHDTIRTGGPITADEAQALLDEIHRQRSIIYALEAFVRTSEAKSNARANLAKALAEPVEIVAVDP